MTLIVAQVTLTQFARSIRRAIAPESVVDGFAHAAILARIAGAREGEFAEGAVVSGRTDAEQFDGRDDDACAVVLAARFAARYSDVRRRCDGAVD